MQAMFISLANLIGQLNVDLILQLVLATIMLGVGFSLKKKDFNYIHNNKSLLIIGLVIKLLLLPLMGFILLEQTSLSSVSKLGIMILLIAPGGTTTNVITYWFNGTSILTIFLTSISSLVCIVSIPMFVNLFNVHYFGQESFFSLPVQQTSLNIFLIIILPSLIGLYVSEKHSLIAQRIEKVIKPLSAGLLGLVFVIKFFAPAAQGGVNITLADIYQLLPILILINIAGIVIGFILPILLGRNHQDSMTIGIEAGIQNAALAILIGSVFLSNNELVKPALIYAMFSFWTTTAFAFIIRKRYYEKNWN